jgi:cytochrome oxidase Cu insertion factor (SCO1/SenC/PrrC family)
MVKRNQWKWGALALVISVLALAVSREPTATNQSSAQPETVDALERSSFLNNLVDVELVDQHSRSFQPTTLKNHVVLFNFIYTSCGSICPMQTKILSQVLQELPADVRNQVRFVSVSIDPQDTPDRLRHFSETMDADLDGWSFLAGDSEQITGLAQRLRLFDVAESGAADKPQNHRASLWLVDKQGQMLQRYRGDPPDKERLIKEITQVSSIR